MGRRVIRAGSVIDDLFCRQLRWQQSDQRLVYQNICPQWQPANAVRRGAKKGVATNSHTCVPFRFLDANKIATLPLGLFDSNPKLRSL